MSDSKVDCSKVHLKQAIALDENKKTEKKSIQPQHEVVESITGTIQKRKSTFKSIKPNSLKNSSEIDGNKKIIIYKLTHSMKFWMCWMLIFETISTV